MGKPKPIGITRWHAERHPANKQHGNYMAVHLFGLQKTGWATQGRVSELIKIPLTDEEMKEPTDIDHMRKYVARAMQLSANNWTGRIP